MSPAKHGQIIGSPRGRCDRHSSRTRLTKQKRVTYAVSSLVAGWAVDGIRHPKHSATPQRPPGVVLPPEVPQMLTQGMQMLASPPPNVPNEVCRFNTVRVPCP